MMNEEQARAEFIRRRWGAAGPQCPYCGTGQPYEIASRSKFRCRGVSCKKDFSPTSGTVYHSRKLSFAMMLDAMQKAGSQSALALAEDLNIQPKTAWSLSQRAKNEGQDMSANSANYRSYQSRSTGNLMPVGMNYLSDLVVRPGMRKFLWPLCLYRGQMNPGHAHRLWNFSLLMMAADAETLADGMKLAHNPAYAQLCGPVNRPQKITMYSFFGRLWNSPDVTDNIPGFTDYVRSMGLGPSWLTPVDRETSEQYCAPWRVSTHPDFDPKAEKPESGIRNLYYPYLVSDPDQSEGNEIVLLVNEIVSKQLPAQIRADACQDLAVAILSGEIAPQDAYDWVNRYVRDVFKMHPTKFDATGPLISFDQPAFANSDRPTSMSDRF